MGFTGNPGEVKAYAKRLAHLAANSKYIAKGAAPKIEKLVQSTMRAGTDPYGAPHVPAKSGGKALAGAAVGDAITVRVERSGKAIRTVVAYPLHFHHHGTHSGGRKTARAITKRIKSGFGPAKGLIRPMTKAQWKKAGRGEESYAEYRADVKSANAFTRAEHKDRATSQATAEVRAARGKVWDPERPLIPNDAQGIPKPWTDAVLESAVVLLDQVGAERKG